MLYWGINRLDPITWSDCQFNSGNVPGFVLMTHRWYNPTLGRFWTADPIGYEGGLNTYAYCRNNPVNHMDPSGLDGENILETIEHAVTDNYAGLRNQANPQNTAALTTATTAAVRGASGLRLLQGASFLGETGLFGVGVAAAVGLGCLAEQHVGRPIARQMFPMDTGAQAALPEATRIFNQMRNCFVAGTLVAMADGSFKPIEQVQKGDVVLSRDETSGQVVAQSVVQTFTREVEETLLLRFDNGEEVQTTPGHPFFVEGQGWTLAGQLAIGSAIVTRAGPATKLTSVQNKTGRTRVFNFEVANTHSYFVGTGNGGLWVHNLSFGQARNALRTGATSVYVNDEQTATDLLYSVFIQRQSKIVWHNAAAWTPEQAKDYYTFDDEGYYHFDNQVGVVGNVPGRLLHHPLNDANSRFRHIQIHAPSGRVTRICYGPQLW